MIISIINEHLKATFDTKGAELQHLTGVDSDTEYLWSGNSDYWGKFSPILFPIVGALKDNTYIFEGNKFQLPRHGFARDLDFEVSQIAANEVLFTLRHSKETLKVYPFEFELNLRYVLTGANLTCTYTVINPGNKELLFSLGAHPAFAAPLNEEGTYTDYFLAFNNDESLTYYHIVDNLISDRTSTLPLNNGRLFLQHELFYDDALVFKDLKSDSISLMNTKNYNGLNFKFKDFPYFGIWAARDANFVCLEPWCGIADSIHHHQELKEKEGIVSLKAQDRWQRCWEVTCF